MATTPTCPGDTGQTSYDVRNVSCVETLAMLFNAYMALLAGQQRIEVRFNERWVTYNKGDATKLVETYTTLYSQCPDAKMQGLPDLNPAKRVKRGPPARGFQTFPHL